MKADRKGKMIPVEIKEAVKYGDEGTLEKEPDIFTLSNKFNLLGYQFFFSYKMEIILPLLKVNRL